MKRLLWLFGVSLFLGSFSAAQRLPEIAVPENYRLSFAPDFAKDNFDGNETIQIRLLKPTVKVVLNAAEIDFKDATISSGGVSQKARVFLDKEKEFATLVVQKEMPAGPATVQIQYSGVLNGQLRGFYSGKTSDGKKYAVTQFEATDARRAFPSFDEPAYKATYDITVIADRGKVAISNKPVIADTPGPGEDEHTVKFATTAKMSTYLVAVAVGDFEYIEGAADGIPIRVYSTPGKKQSGAFALATAEHCIRYYDHYFGIKYPFEKLDLIGLPDFAAGAMENAGAITFREIVLLLDEKQASIAQEKRVATVVAHEIAHQWFGDLVTMKWWDDIWLNEGFATWMESKPIAAWKPEWNLPLDDVLDANRTLEIDSLANTRPIHEEADTPAQIQELFDGIAYGKAAAVLRMLENYLGPDNFRKGVVSYLKQHEYGNSTADDFWRALTEASKKPVDQIMPTFVKQPGPPLVSIKSTCEGGATRVTLSQQRYFSDRTLFERGTDALWQIPACIKAETNGKSVVKCELLTKQEESFAIPGCAEWILANADAAGYYRSGYALEVLSDMSRSFEARLSPAERIQSLSDSWAAVRVGLQPLSSYLALSGALSGEENAQVMEQGVDQIRFIGDRLVTDVDRPTYERWVRSVMKPMATELGWQPGRKDSDDRKALRAQVLYTLGYSGRDSETLTQSSELADQLLASPNAVDRSMVSTVLNLAALTGDESLYDQVVGHMKDASSPDEYYRLQEALGRFANPKLIERTLSFALTPAVRSQDMTRLIAAVMGTRAGQLIAWDFVRAHWQQIDAVQKGYNSGSIVRATGSFCSKQLHDEVQGFFATHPVPEAQRTLRQSLERIDYCVDLGSRQSAQLASWLNRHESSAGSN
jgi:aminopeptidase N/puromycin-sensitive aminopeptidase